MNDPYDYAPMPRDFGWRYVLWILWSNAITLLAIAQGCVATLMLDKDIFDHATFRYVVLGNAILTGVVAQVKRNTPTPPPPLKAAPNGN